MIIFPAVDLKDGQCVRLMQGDMSQSTVYENDPAAVARRWQDLGAEWLHVVDLDGAFAREPRNKAVVAAILAAVTIPLQLGGGIRNLGTIREYVEMGVRRVILGTVALRQPELVEEACALYPGSIALGIDARHGLVAIEGWKETTGTDAISLVRRFSQAGVAAVIYTDIHRDGMQSGVNVDATRRFLKSSNLPVIASGGVASLEDIRALLPLVPHGLAGVITGRALYDGTLDLREALALVKDYLEKQKKPAHGQ
ncbi:MAG: 1-(5-phosphoribosyl)-5-[(5-phosphoribosylamino)methylideneamino]imidazole-4-carboxamide isomerase [Deltaproteobacteria bacterium]|nr:1-(5-phosphoribosyl)-5-[(5-phosphoribosylamino)methylideneamino]imidazole-4-carboxamide isomerase [Deltaproteobacteria bacterium]